MTRARQLLVICALGCTLGPRALHAQSADEPRGRFELSGGAVWTGATNFGDQPATETALAGERFELFSTSTTLASTPDLVAALGCKPTQVAVERNREIVRRADHAAVRLADGDRIEVVTFFGGG